MGLYFRKSVGFGPFRLNFSKSGLSTSIGVKGARLSLGQRGTYVTMSSHGIIYRQKVDTSKHLKPKLAIKENEPIYIGKHTITSDDILNLTDVDSRTFIEELTEKSKKIHFVTWFGKLPLVIFIIAIFLLSFKSKEIVSKPKKNWTVIKVGPQNGLNLHLGPYRKSKVLKYAFMGETFLLLDSTMPRWFKVEAFGKTVFINKKEASIENEHSEKISSNEYVLINPGFMNECGGGIIAFVVLIIWLNREDKKRLEVEINYEMDDTVRAQFVKFCDYFSEFNRSLKVWQKLHTQSNTDYKRHAGAGRLISRILVKERSSNKIPLKFFKTNVNIPYLKLKDTEFYFLPERLLIKRDRKFAAVFYKNLTITISQIKHVETENLASDVQVVEYTWRYLNKKGGPDKRFKDNRQIPICLYSEYSFKSITGVNEVIVTSKPGAFNNFTLFLGQIGQAQSYISSMKIP